MYDSNHLRILNDVRQAEFIVRKFNEYRETLTDGFTMYGTGVLHSGDGYIVGTTPEPFDTVWDAAKALASRMDISGNRFAIGFWRDPEDGKEYIDVVLIT